MRAPDGEPRPYVTQVLQTANEEAGRDQQQEGDGHLRGDERLAQASVAAARHGTALVLERGCEVGVGGLQGGNETEGQRRDERHGEVEQENASIRRGRQPQFRAVLRQKVQKRFHAGVRHGNAYEGARERQQYAFHQQLTDDLPAARAKRQA